MATGTEDSHRVTIEDINKVTEELGPDELKLLYDNLGIDHVKVAHAEASAGTTDTRLKARAVLREWLQEKADGATCEALFSGRDTILKRRTGKPEADTQEFNLKECQDQLQEMYLGSDMKVQLTPWDPEHAVEMDAIFVNLEMEKDEVSPSQTKRIPLQRNEDLVTLKTSTGKRVNRILIQGEPGSGKSTLLNNIAYKWALQIQNTRSQSQDPSLSQFDLVFIINVHEIFEKTDSLEDIIFDQILEEGQNVSKTSLKSYLKVNSQRCLFLIDGIDEDTVGIVNSDSLGPTTPEISCLLYNKLLKQSCVIASLRPYKLQAMGHKQRHFTKVKLTGFSDENIEKYLGKYFAGHEVNYTDLLRRLKEEPHIWSLAGTPLLLLFFCLLWNEQSETGKESLPNTRTQLYKETIECLWKRYHYARQGLLEEDIATDEHQLELMSFLETFGKVTLVGMIDQNQEKVLFADNDFEKATLSLALRVGFLSKEKIRSKQHKTWVKFLHTSFQDFCSAVYLANLHFKNNEKCKECITKLLCTVRTPWASRSQEVLIFCAGCRPETAKLIIHQFIAVKDNVQILAPGVDWDISTEAYISIPLHFIIAYEAQLTYEECHKIVSFLLQAVSAGCDLGYSVSQKYFAVKHIQYQLELIKSVTDTTNGLMFSLISAIELELNAIEFIKCYPVILSMLQYTKQNLMRLFKLTFEFPNAPNQSFDFFELFDVLVNLTKLQYLILDNKSKTPGKVLVSNIHKICHIKLVELKVYHIAVKMTSLTEFLNQNTSLKELTISNPPGMYAYNNTFGMIKALSEHKTCERLVLDGIAIGRAVKHLKFIIPQLIELLLYRPCLDVWDIHELAAHLRKAEAMETLEFFDVTFGTAISNLANQLKYMVNLRQLELVKCGLGNIESDILIDGIKEMGTLHKLDLSLNPNIGLMGKLAIANLHILPQFQELKMAYDSTPCDDNDSVKIHVPDDSTSVELIMPRYKTQLELEAIRKSQTPTLPDCCFCMSQIYNCITCKMSSKKSSSKVTDIQDTIAGRTDSTTTSSKLTKPKKNDGEKKCNPGPLAYAPAGKESFSMVELASPIQQASVTSKLMSPSDDRSRSRKQTMSRCFNLMCSKPKTEVPGGLKKCTRCKTVSYCCKDCQTEHWKIHRSSCKEDLTQEESLSRELLIKEPIQCCFNLKCSKPETEVPGGLKKCTRCKTASYCGRDCQTEHWKIHRSTCGKEPVQQKSLSRESLIKEPIQYCFNLECSKPETEVPGDLKKCTRCKTVSYCSRDCQKEHWKIHRSTCRPKVESLSRESLITEPVLYCSNSKCTKPEAEVPVGLKKCTRCKTVSYCSRDCQTEHWKIHRSSCKEDLIQEEQLSRESLITEPVLYCSNSKCTKPETEVPGGFKKCTRCKTVSYCGRDCQTEHWKIHRSTCKEDFTQEESLSRESLITEPIQYCCNLKCSKPEAEVPGGLKKCTRCKTASYCSRDCQTEHWKIHQSTCKPKEDLILEESFSR